MSLKMTVEELSDFMEREFPQRHEEFTIEELDEMRARVRLNVSNKHLRPGNLISGPAIFALVDCGTYLTLLAMIGPEAMSVTTNCSLDFMRPAPAADDLFAECRLLKLGRTLAVGDVMVFSGDKSEPVARASVTYSIPRRT